MRPQIGVQTKLFDQSHLGRGKGPQIEDTKMDRVTPA